MSTYLKLFNEIEAQVHEETTEASQPIQPLKVAAQTNLRAIENIKEAAKKARIDISITTPVVTTGFENPKRTTPVIIADVSGSMLTPENRALCLLMAAKTKGTMCTQFIGCHTQGILFESAEDFVNDKRTGGTILSEGLKTATKELGFNYKDSSYIYYLTDGDNWQDDNGRFVHEVITMLNAGEVNRMVVHVSNSKKSTSITDFILKCEALAEQYKGFSLVVTDNKFENSRANAETAYAGFFK